MRSNAIGVFLALLAATGCGRTVASGVAVRHPLQAGVVDANVVEVGRMPARDRAALVELTAERICAEVELYARNERDSRAVLESYDIGLVADDDSVEQRDPTIVRGPPHTAHGTLFANASRGYRYHPSSLCFRNHGFVRMSTERLRLELRAAGRSRSLVFQWDLVPATASTDPSSPPESRAEGRAPGVFVRGN